MKRNERKCMQTGCSAIESKLLQLISIVWHRIQETCLVRHSWIYIQNNVGFRQKDSSWSNMLKSSEIKLKI